ncbi:MAG: YerC/YecD family TrpR-related protein [Eubacteriaceae bacterium]|nr:YerC/YecD family TrpR-related protein [Eubacteriaceae bacterium]MDD4507396.1 YerC/YecD family TrpR-related protein [Eubacteriaceae bacterium]
MEDNKRKDLARALLAIQSEQECYDLLDDMCTIKEVEDMSNRFYIARLLSEGKTFIDVEKKTGASSATISRVNRCLKHGCGYRLVIDRIAEQEDS